MKLQADTQVSFLGKRSVDPRPANMPRPSAASGSTVRSRYPVTDAGPAAAMPRAALWLHLHLPGLPLEVLTRTDTSKRACVLAAGAGRKRRVQLTNRHAAILGIRPGMPLAAAHALGDLCVFERDTRSEQQALERLCLWAMQWTPVVCPVAPDGLLLEIGASLKLFGGLDGMLARLRRELRQLGYRVDYAVAPTPLAATVLARTRPGEVVADTRQLLPVLSGLPLDALRLETRQRDAISGLGVKTLGECRRLPRDGLARRFSPEFVNALDRLFGQLPDPRHAFSMPRSFEADIDLPWEVNDTQSLAVAAEQLLRELCGYLRAGPATTRTLRWALRHTDGRSERLLLELARAGNDADHMALLMREKLSRLRLQSRVTGLRLLVNEITLQATPATDDLFDPGRVDEAEACAAFIDRLAARCGENVLHGIGLRSRHDPQRAWCRYQPPVKPVARQTVTGKPDGSVRPVWMLERARKLITRDGLPEFDGPLSLVAERERIVSHWWEDGGVARDYFVATTRRGSRLWIYRELGDGQWYLQGIFE